MNWLKYSGVFLTFAVNPFHWRLGFEYGKDELNAWSLKLNLLPLGVHIVVDDGSW